MKKAKGIRLRTRWLSALCALLLLCTMSMPTLADEQPAGQSGTAATGGSPSVAGSDDPVFMSQYLSDKTYVAGKDTVTLPLKEVTAESQPAFEKDLYGEAGEALLSDDKTGTLSWNFKLETAGWYVVRVKYAFPNTNGINAMRSVLIDGELLYKEADNVAFARRYKDVGEVWVNNIGDEVRPSVEEISCWQEKQLYDANGYYSMPLCFPLEAGEHSLSLTYGTQDMYIASVVLEPYATLPTYAEVKADYPQMQDNDTMLTFQAEDKNVMGEKSDSTVRMESNADPSTVPIAYGYRVFNIVGGGTWKKGNQALDFAFKVPADGLYRITLRVLQSWNDGLPSYRTIAIDGKVPFDELREVRFDYSTDWQTVTLGNGEEDYLFYLTKGEHVMTMSVTMGAVTDIVQKMYDNMTRMSTMMLDITKLTGGEPDPNYDYQFFKNIPTMESDLRALVADMQALYDAIYAISGKDTSMGSNLISSIKQLQGMIEDPYTIARRYSQLTQVQTNLGSWYLSMQSMPLAMDEFTVSDGDTVVPARKATFWQKLRSTVKSFFVSFYKDYDNIGGMLGEGVEIKETIDVWFARGTEWANILKEMADEGFTPQTGIALDINVIAASQLGSGSVNALMLSIISDQAPDVVMGSSAQVVDMSVRDALVDLKSFDDFDEVSKRFLEQSFVPFTHRGGVWGMPECMEFTCLFYRTDVLDKYGIKVPDTREELYDKTLPQLFQEGLSYYAPQSFEMFLFQHGGQLYTDDGHYSALDTDQAYKAFREYTEMFTHYSAPVAANFFNRFRNGEMPIGIGNYALYIQLLAAAPEITGKWEIAPLPGLKEDDGDINRAYAGLVSGLDALIAQKSDPKYEESWEFLKWWSSTEVQRTYAKEIEAMVGVESRWASANKEAFLSLGWDKQDIEVIQEQWKWARETPGVLGASFAGRYLGYAFNNVVVTGSMTVRDALEDAVKADATFTVLMGERVKGRRQKMKQATLERRNSFSRFIRKNYVGYLMEAPFAILFIVFTLAPVAIALFLSFTDYNMLQTPNFVGLKNYELLLVDDPYWWTAVSNTLTYAVIVGPLGYFASFFMAWVLNQLKGRSAFALAFYAPSITSGVAMSVIWLYFFSSDRYGLINNALLNLGIIEDPILWTNNPETIMPVVIFISIWMSMGTGFLVFLAGLQNVDKSLYEAGAIDGVRNRFQELRYLTFPQMKPQLLFGAINAITGAFSVFDIPMTVAGMPGPNYANHTMVMHLYDYAFVRFQMGYASAVATVVFVVTFVVGRVIMRVLRE